MEALEKQKFHFIAIGGIGMSGLAKYILESGGEVSGSDLEDNKYLDQIRKLGGKIFIGHNSKNVPNNSIVVVSTAIKNDNPELLRAKELNLEIIHRSDLLEIIADKFSKNKNSTFIGFSGTHGKTTTSGLCAYLLNKINMRASFVVGGILPELNTNAKFNDDKFFVAELDESDGTIVKYVPDISVINNLEIDHIDFFKNGLETLLETFSLHLKNLNDKKILINNDCKGNLELIKRNQDIKFITFGLINADYTAKNIEYYETGSKFTVYKNTKKLGEFELSILGKHNVYNALAVISALNENKIELEKIKPYLKNFMGIGRRFQKVGNLGSIRIYDDYAHHPSEIKTTLESIKNPNGRVVAIFQPHRFTRLKGLWDDFLKAFDNADKLVAIDVYEASEIPIKEVTSKNFIKSIKHKDAIYVCGDVKTAAKEIKKLLKDNDLVITLGAGDVTKIGKYLIEKKSF